MEEHQGCILDANCTKVNIGEIVDGLNIQRSSERCFKSTLKKFPKLFNGGLGKLDMEPVLNNLKESLKPYQGRYFNIPQIYNKPTRKEINTLVAIDVLRKVRYNNDSPWATLTFA